jgi:DNA/RNA endonuclease YhcR with UshA esterase domain
MKTWLVVILTLSLAVVVAPGFAAPKAGSQAGVPKYNPATETVIKGTVDEVRDRECPVSGGVGSHIVLKIGDGKTIEVHLATTKFMKNYDLVFNKGEQLEVTGSKVTFEGVETIFAREVKRGNDTFVFRDKEGNPVW